MATQKPGAERNRIASDLDRWKRVEDKLMQRYGRKVVYDRDFIKAKREIYKHIRDKNKNKPLNLYERAEMRVLRSQHRNMLRQLYPNPIVRLLRNVLVFAGNLIKLAFKALMAVGKFLLGPASTQRQATVANPRQEAARQQTAQQQQQKQQQVQAATKQKTTQQKQSGTRQAPAIVRKLPTKARVQMPPSQGKGMRR